MQHVETRESITLENQGEKIFAVLHRPLKEGKVPAIVICPGFGGNKSGKFRIFVTLAKELARQGIAVLRFDYRGSGDSEGEYADITIEGKVSDALVALQFLSEDSRIDASRIGILGRSLGGAIALLVASRFKYMKSIVLWAPVFKSDPWRQLWESMQVGNSLDDSKQEVLRHLPPSIPNTTFLKQFFALDLPKELEELKEVPLLHIHGSEDLVVKIEHAKDFEKARVKDEKTRFLQLEKGDHDFSSPQDQKIAIEDTCYWYKKTL